MVRKSSKPIKEGERWRRAGAAELERARLSQKGGFFIAACFCAHQAVEKTLKGFLFTRGEAPQDGHSLAELCSSCACHNPSFASLQSLAATLDRLYTPAEGFVSLRTFTEEEVEEALEAASQLLVQVGKLWEERA